ncbi:MAG: sensor histidine kinase [Lachnospiraceae bacterium]
MYELFRKITQNDLQSLAELNKALAACDNTTDIIRDKNVFLFPDGHAWQYSAEEITTRQGKVYIEAIFDDVTELYEKQQELNRQSREMEKMYRELKVLSGNILEMTREQEILNLKSRLHDQMNMGVAAIRQILRQNTASEGNAAAVMQFRRAIQILQEENAYPQDDISEFIRDAAVSGVRVEINGELPAEGKLLNLLLAIMREACINAARHADATAMYVVSEQTETTVTLHITNDGRQPEKDITPRGGLVYLEKYITRAGGRMEIQSQPEFLLTITLPVGTQKKEQEVQK